jgi:N-acetylglucosamine-6-sulfatase
VCAAGLVVISVTACGGNVAAPTSAAPSSPARPNFVVIVADDMAYGLIGPSSRIPFLHLPNLDGLAARGVQFDNAFVTTSLCSPSRATLLSGLYAHTHGVIANETTDLSDQIDTYPRILQRAGYDTAFIGKWHMDSRTDMPRPGFDRWVSFRGQGVYQDPMLNVDGKTVARTGYITDLLTQYAVDWLNQRTAKPFLLILSHKAVHEPFTPAPRHATAMADASFPEPASFEDTFDDKPAWQRRYVACGGQSDAFTRCPDPLPAALPQWPWPAHERWRLEYMRTLLALDDSVGSVVSTLAGRGLTGATYVVFLSDNGVFLGEHRLGDKRLAYEESMRVPLVFGGADLAARHVNAAALNLDLAPTLVDLAGIAVPSNMQGRSLAGLLRGTPSLPRDEFLYEYDTERPYPVVPDIFAVRTPTRKYVTYPGDPSEDELYDLATDPGEMVNLAARPEWVGVRTEMRARLQRLLTDTGATP